MHNMNFTYHFVHKVMIKPNKREPFYFIESKRRLISTHVNTVLSEWLDQYK